MDMTRETKVGLIFGLGVILLVGIFISDYLNDLDGLQDESVPENFADYNQSTTNQSAALNVPVAGNAEQTPQQLAALTLDQHEPLGARQPIVTQPAPPVRQFGQGVGSSDIAPIGVGVPNHQTPPAVGEIAPEPILPQVALGPQPLTPPTNQRSPLVDTTEVDMLRQPDMTGTGRVSRVEHTVKTGETLASIARRYYDGDENMWRSIRDANPGKVGANGEVNANVSLVIPVRSVDTALANEGTPDITNRIGEGTAAAARSRMLVVTVKEGDTLSALASQHLGSAGKWRELMDANADVLQKPEQLLVGMRLRIPSQETEALLDQANRALAEVEGAAPLPTPREETRPPAGRTYTVVSGDNLYRIADKALGNGERYREIFEANRDQLKNPDDIRVGMVLKMPAAPASRAQ